LDFPRYCGHTEKFDIKSSLEERNGRRKTEYVNDNETRRMFQKSLLKNLRTVCINAFGHSVMDLFGGHQPSKKEESAVKADIATYRAGINKILFGKRNEIAQKLMELAYHIYGK